MKTALRVVELVNEPMGFENEPMGFENEEYLQDIEFDVEAMGLDNE